MCGAATAKRRRKQAANGYKHLAKIGRPKYPKAPGTAQARDKREKAWLANKAKGLF